MRVVLVAILLTIGLAGCQRQKPALVEVGRFRIYQEDLKYYDKILADMHPYYKSDGTLKLAQTQLIKFFKMATVLEQNGQSVNDEVLKNEAKRIDRDTKDPRLLSIIKARFHKNESAYLKIYVLPVLVERMLPYEFFPYEKQIHALPLENARAFLSSVGKRAHLYESEAKARKLKIRRLKILKSGEIVSDSANPLLQKNRRRSEVFVDRSPKRQVDSRDPVVQFDPQAWANEHQSDEGSIWLGIAETGLRPGDVFDKVVETSSEFSVVKLVSQNKKGDLDFESVSFAKLAYDQWLSSEMEKVKPRMISSAR